DHVAVSLTVRYTGLTTTVLGNLDTTNTSSQTVAIGGIQGRFEYFSPSQNAWVVLARAAYDGSGQRLPSSTHVDPQFFASLREAPGPGVHVPTGTLFFASLDAGAVAKWQYGITTQLSS